MTDCLSESFGAFYLWTLKHFLLRQTLCFSFFHHLISGADCGFGHKGGSTSLISCCLVLFNQMTLCSLNSVKVPQRSLQPCVCVCVSVYRCAADLTQFASKFTLAEKTIKNAEALTVLTFASFLIKVQVV